jgi:hypothetical protein
MVVEAGVTVEVSTAQYAIAEGRLSLALSVEFRGLAPTPSEIVLHGGYGFTQVREGSLPWLGPLGYAGNPRDECLMRKRCYGRIPRPRPHPLRDCAARRLWHHPGERRDRFLPRGPPDGPEGPH